MMAIHFWAVIVWFSNQRENAELNDINDISPPALYSWASQRESGQDNVGVLSSSASPTASSHGWRRRGKNTDRNPDPGSPGPSSPVDCGLQEENNYGMPREMFKLILTVENLAVVLVILAVVGPAEPGAQTKVCQLDVPVCI